MVSVKQALSSIHNLVFLTATQQKKQAKRCKSPLPVMVLLGLISAAFLTSGLFSFSPNSALPASSTAPSTGLPFYLSALEFISLPAPVSQTPVFPYSVIPGGVSSASALRLALRRDPLVAAHYSGFQASAAHLIRLRQNRSVYVSYRIGNRIFWTTRKITLRAGETLLSDGKNLVRTRCGNRISDGPRLPASPAEPSERVFNSPLTHPDPAVSLEALPARPFDSETPYSAPTLTTASLVPPTPGASTGGGLPPGTIIPPFCCGGGYTPSTSSTTPVPPSAPLPPPGPTVATPEPATFLLLSLGLIGILIFSIFRPR